ncbi:MAG: histidine phosphatase family protein [bacterium]|nr:histidine phosphatase family protein [bacterium]
MKIFLVRHAEGEEFTEKWQAPDTPLSEKGRRQAEVLGKLPRFRVIDKILSSNWKRAAETAEFVAKNINTQVEAFKGIEERHQSSKIYGLIRTDKISEDYSKIGRLNRNDWNWKWDLEEESFNEVCQRTQKFKEHILKTYSHKNILIFSHETFIRLFISTCLFNENWDKDYYRQFSGSTAIEVTGISLLIYREELKQWKLWYLNDYSHLGFVKPSK